MTVLSCCRTSLVIYPKIIKINMSVFQFYIIGGCIAVLLLLILVHAIPTFFKYIIERDLLSDPEFKKTLEQYAMTIGDDNVYNTLLNVFLITCFIFSYIGILAIIFMLIDFILDNIKNPKNKTTHKHSKKHGKT